MNKAEDQILVPQRPLERWTTEVFETAGLDSADATLAAHCLVRTDARGIKTHGLSRLKSYLEKVRTGEMAIGVEPSYMVDGNFCRINAGGVLGQISGPKAIDTAVRMAQDAPAVMCQLYDTGHLGALGIHTLRAAEAGLVALMFQATPPVIGMVGGQQPLIGNNPISMAAPRPNGPPIVVDMACCEAARGNVLLAAREGKPIPEGWALDLTGRPTTDARAALLGSLLPFGGHKGLALAMIVEILASSLAGATFQKRLNDAGVRSGIGHMNALIIVINPNQITGREAYEAHVASWTDHFRKEGPLQARIPGERAHEAELRAEEMGVPLLRSILEELIGVGAAAGAPFPS